MVKLDRVSAAAVFHQDGVAGVAHDRRVWKNAADDAGILSRVAGFLAQFAPAGDLGRNIFGIHHAAGDFEFDRIRTMTVLFDHH